MFEKWTLLFIASAIGYVGCREGWILDFPTLLEEFFYSVGLGEAFREYVYWPMFNILACLNGPVRIAFLCLVVYCPIHLSYIALREHFAKPDA